MTTNPDFRIANESDLEDVQVLLKRAGLPSDDLTPPAMRNFILLRDANDELLAAGGIERYGRDGLLRSVVVSEKARGQGLGGIITHALEQHALKHGISTLYLLTTTAAGFFPRLGYAQFERNAVPSAVAQSAEFASLCPASAVCLKKHLE